MPYVQRDALNKIAGCYAQRQAGYAEEFLADDHPEVVAYFNPPPPTEEELARQCRDAFSRDRLFRAKCISDLAFRLGKGPGQLTQAEIAAERDRLAAIYKALS